MTAVLRGFTPAALTFVVAMTEVSAQDSATRSAPPRPEFGIGLTTRVPAISDAGIGPVLSALVRVPARPGRTGFLAGASYAIVPILRTLPDGNPNNSASEAGYLSIGPEWMLGLTSRIDVQWNPAIAGVRRWGNQPSWSSKVSTQRDWSSASVGVRWGLEDARVGYALRLHASLNPLAIFGSVFPSFQVMVRP